MINPIYIKLSGNRLACLYEMNCNICNYSLTEEIPLHNDRNELKIIAKNKGWVVCTEKTAYCPHCKEFYYKVKNKRPEVVRYKYNVCSIIK